MNHNPPRILFITRKYPPLVGGMEQLSYYLTTRISFPRGIIAWRHTQRWLPVFALYATFRALFTAWRYDMIHVGDPVLAVVARAIKLVYPRKKIVTTVHGLDVTYSHPAYRFYRKLLGNPFDLYICISQSTKRMTEKAGLKPLVVIPVGVDAARWKGEHNRAELSSFLGVSCEDRFVMLTTGRLVKRKGVGWFVKNVVQQLPPSVLYCVIGTGTREAEIQKIIKNRGLENRVNVLGKVADDDLRMMYNTADLFVMPNVVVQGDAEGFGIVAIEAGAAGLPVLASNIEGIQDAVIEGKNGWLVESGNAGQFVQTIQEKMESRDALRAFGIAAQEYVQKHYDWSVIITQYEDEFKKFTTE